jgi:pimeloyl-ACP methyl ester carboxylesterase
VAATERELRVPVEGGELVGLVRDGPPDSRNALILHGGPGMSDYTSTLADELEDLLTTARYQQRGLAPSVVDGDVSVEGHVRDAVAVIDKLGWHKPVVIGHSWGGYLALHLAVAHAHEIGALVILDSLGATGDGGVKQFVPNLRSGISAETLARIVDLEALEKPSSAEQLEHFGYIWPQYFGEPSTAPEMPDFQFAENAGETWPSINGHFKKGTLARKLPKVHIPALIINGDRSPIPLEQGDRIAQLLPGATFIVQHGSGHFGWLEEPGFIHDQIAQFLDVRR